MCFGRRKVGKEKGKEMSGKCFNCSCRGMGREEKGRIKKIGKEKTLSVWEEKTDSKVERERKEKRIYFSCEGKEGKGRGNEGNREKAMPWWEDGKKEKGSREGREGGGQRIPFVWEGRRRGEM